jgi:DNA-binding Lrp family transcriptional regulator
LLELIGAFAFASPGPVSYPCSLGPSGTQEPWLEEIERGSRLETRIEPGQGRREVAEVQAYILIQTEVGKAAQVAKEVRDIVGVDAAEDVTGPYDVIVRASAGNVDDLGKLVVAKIQSVDGITRTLTCPVVHL